MKLFLTATLVAWSFFFNCALGGAAMEDEPKPFLRGTTDNVVQGEDQEGNRILRNVLGTSEVCSFDAVERGTLVPRLDLRERESLTLLFALDNLSHQKRESKLVFAR